MGRPTSGLIGVKAGVISRMNLDITPARQSGIGSCAQVFTDFPVGHNVYFTTAFDFYYVAFGGANQIMIEPSAGVKRAFPLSRARMLITPGVAVGFAYLSHVGDVPPSRFLGLKLFVEAHFTIDARRAWVGELALFDAPTGSNSNGHLSFGPGVMLRWGVAFR